MSANKKIKLPKGWWMELDPSTRPAGEFQGFVFAPFARDSASLNFALDMGTTSGDLEIPIPEEVLKELEKYAELYG